MSRFRVLGLLSVAVMLLIIAAPGAAQQRLDPKQPYALIFGTVYGPDDFPAANVVIKIRRADQKKPKWELVSDRRGEFAQRFPAGAADYIITTHVDKKYGLENKEVKVHIDNDERQDVALHLTKVEPQDSRNKDLRNKDQGKK